MVSEKDPFGDKLKDAEKAREDQYFAKRDRELVEKLREQKEGEQEAELKSAASMRCPKCGEKLVGRVVHGVTVDDCPACGGLWLDKGEFEDLARRENEGWLGRLLRARES